MVQATYAVTPLNAMTFHESSPSSIRQQAAIELPSSSRNNLLPTDSAESDSDKDDELLANDDDVAHSYVRLVEGHDDQLADNNKGAP